MAANPNAPIPPKSSATPSGKRLLPLDVLRTVAVLLVLGNHMLPAPTEWNDLIEKSINRLQSAGWVGVDLFFVLSGFLVSGLLFREQMRSGNMGIGRFLIRRGLKIYPALYFLVLVTVIVRVSMGDMPRAHQVIGELLFFQNYIGALWGHTWSLAVEEHFYLTLPLFLLILARLARHAPHPFAYIPQFFLAVAAIELAARVFTNLMWEYRHGSHILVSHLRFDSLLFGVFLSYYYHYHAEAFVRYFSRWSLPLLAVSGLLLCPVLLVLPRQNIIVPTIGLTIIYGFSGVLLSWLMIINFPQNAFTRFIGYIGSHSYSIYLWHYAVVHWFMMPLDSWNVPWLVYTPAYVALSIIAGILLAKLVEFPVLRLRDRWFPSLTQPLTQPNESGPLGIHSKRKPAADESTSALRGTSQTSTLAGGAMHLPESGIRREDRPGA